MNIHRIARKISRLSARITDERFLGRLDPISKENARSEIINLQNIYSDLYLDKVAGTAIKDVSGRDSKIKDIVQKYVLILLRLPPKDASQFREELLKKAEEASRKQIRNKKTTQVESLSPVEPLHRPDVPVSDEITVVPQKRRMQDPDITGIVPWNRLQAFVDFSYRQAKDLREDALKTIETRLSGKKSIDREDIKKINQTVLNTSPSFGNNYFQDYHYELAEKMLKYVKDNPILDEEKAKWVRDRDEYYKSLTKMPYGAYISAFGFCPRSRDLLKSFRVSSRMSRNIPLYALMGIKLELLY